MGGVCLHTVTCTDCMEYVGFKRDEDDVTQADTYDVCTEQPAKDRYVLMSIEIV